jgi:uroporphyrinogen-III synthase
MDETTRSGPASGHIEDAPAAADDPSPTPKPARRGIGPATLVMACAVTAVAGAGLALAAQSFVDGFTGVSARLASLENRLTAPVGAGAAAAPTGAVAVASADPAMPAGAQPGYLLQRIEALQLQTAELSRQLSTASTAAQLAQVEGRVDTLAAEIPAVASILESGRAARAGLALAAADQAGRTSGPFVEAWQGLAAVLPDDPNVQALKVHAATGAPGRSDLAAAWARIRTAVLASANRATPAGGVLGAVERTLASHVTISRVGDATDPGALVLAADEAIRRGDLNAAVERLSRLDGAPARAVAPFLVQARARLEIDARLQAVRTRLAAAAG